MLEIIEDVLDAEKKADEIITEAKQQATRIRNEFSDQESTRLREAQAAADGRVREELASIREEQDRRVSDAEQRLREQGRGDVPADESRLDEAVRRSVDLIRKGT